MSSSLDIQRNVQLAPHTTINLGGPAAQVVRCVNPEQVREALSYAQKVPVHILGGGSNTVFADEGFAGLVIQIALTGITFTDEGETVLAKVAAGEVWDDFVVQCIERGLAGLECLSGIPGLVGATPMQNVGAYGQEVAESIEVVEALERSSGEKKTFLKDTCGFGYRTSRFKQEDSNRYVVTAVSYRLRKDGVPTVRYPQVQTQLGTVSLGAGTPALQRVREVVLQLRRSKSMLVDASDPHSRSCGSFFTNPVIPKAHLATLQKKYPDIPFFESEESAHSSAQATWLGTHVKIPAAWTIEHAGFSKGDRRDGIGISPNHPLALVNYGGTTQQLLKFAAEIQAEVETKLGIELQQEPVTVPENGLA
ncbi:MAG: UDP-N-acetylmuramate dehydrogenase [Candidatus Andersenbacteria bacterium]